ncbi:conserved hypothetical protein [Trichinella spiralis]|uniref:hypothetical protein n=1 Tax=Trichinella spiralis TaxID=6334 RepID=UPI0001EFE3A1|nr:conserved hypothetical protein [Trichinella spiralis]
MKSTCCVHLMKILDFRLGNASSTNQMSLRVQKLVIREFLFIVPGKIAMVYLLCRFSCISFYPITKMRIDGLEASNGEDFHWLDTETETEEESGEIVNCPIEQQNVDAVSRDDCGGQLGYLKGNLNLLNRILKKFLIFKIYSDQVECLTLQLDGSEQASFSPVLEGLVILNGALDL